MIERSLEITSETRNKWTILKFKGEINFGNIFLMSNAIEREIVQDAKFIALDFSFLEQISSYGVATILKFKERLDLKKGELKVLSPPRNIRDIFELAGVDKLLSIVDSTKDL